jgi:hypothetical protein
MSVGKETPLSQRATSAEAKRETIQLAFSHRLTPKILTQRDSTVPLCELIPPFKKKSGP